MIISKNNLKKYRLIREISQSKLAKKVGISTTHYQNIEYGVQKPNVELAIFLAEALQVEDIKELFPIKNNF